MSAHRIRSGPDGGVASVGGRFQELLALIGHSAAGETMAIMAEAGLTMPQIVTLHVLGQKGPRNVCAIAELLRLSRAATSHLVDQLARRGFVSRREDREDRRQRVVAISPKGARLVERLVAARLGDFEHAMSKLAPDLLSELQDVLGRMIEQLKAAGGPVSKDGGGR